MKYEQLNSVFVIYSRHGWTLRRILSRKERLEDVRERGGVEVFESDIDAAWFSRQSKPGITTWEIRSLEGDQYALCTSIPDDCEVSEAEGILFELEEKMRERSKSGSSEST